MSQQLYIIAGPNGAGKTTASFTILPEIFDCREFVNADEIARGLSPFNPDGVKFQAGRLMLERINLHLEKNETFAFETTLATKSYKSFIQKARHAGYEITLLFLMLDSKELAKERVRIRVKEGGHNIPVPVIERRYDAGLYNFFNIYKSQVNNWMLVNNSIDEFQFVAKGSEKEEHIFNDDIWKQLSRRYEIK